MRRRILWLLLALPALFILAAFAYNLPPINHRVSVQVAELRSRLKYALSPPDEAVFVPQSGGGQGAEPTLPPPAFTRIAPTRLPNSTEPAQAESTPETPISPATATPRALPGSIPERVELEGVVYVDQHNRWNYCGPANLAMALNFWGWSGTRDDVARVVKPGVQDPSLDFIQQGRWDKNVMPYEMADFVNEHTEFNALTRYGGDLEVLKSLIAAGFPVVVEKGYSEADYTGRVAWLGHYLFTTGYDETRGEFTVQDAYLEPGRDMHVDYQTYLDGWRSFDYLFMVIYPPEREGEVMERLGPWADPAWANQHAVEIAQAETETLNGIDEFFAWFNLGTSHVQLQNYGEAAQAFDEAFRVYAEIEDENTQRPYRIMWYQTGPYWAYYYSGRYQDVIDLANTTLYDTISEPTLEESIYWRALAYL
ncbi:MAG: C39 family peptidase, partial [Anaerolineales bacterium]|nr:C39 family peptidase [Anaerolineales bacterium]